MNSKRTNKQADSKRESSARWAALMRKAQNGDREAYRQLLNELCPVLRSYVRNRVSNIHEVEDVVQEILMGLHKARATYIPNRPFSSWMFAIAKYKLIDYERRLMRKRGPEILSEEVLAEHDISASTYQSSLENDVRSAIAKLPEKQRKVVTMLKLEGHSVKEIAHELNASESAVKVTAHRAYKALKKILEKS
ncbi:MAG: sigma-70 family RNA polymerase sigma factor [Candidatus Dadabacteria bacterium]|nr:MAG: sigma-70 family RNA polymerase sigma factor [Candidatus Dadabacteria bacterium]